MEIRWKLEGVVLRKKSTNTSLFLLCFQLTVGVFFDPDRSLEDSKALLSLTKQLFKPYPDLFLNPFLNTSFQATKLILRINPNQTPSGNLPALSHQQLNASQTQSSRGDISAESSCAPPSLPKKKIYDINFTLYYPTEEVIDRFIL